MSAREPFDDALDAAIDAIAGGEPLESVLAAHPQHAEALRPLLETAFEIRLSRQRQAATLAPAAPVIADNFPIIRAAVQRAQLARAPQPGVHVPLRPRVAAWMRRPVAFASLSLPAGVLAVVALAGVGGAAAAGFAAVSVDLPARIQEILPGPSGDSDSSSLATHGPSDGASAAGDGATATLPGASGTHVPLVTVTGEISNVHGNVFDLTAGDDSWKITVEADTVVQGGIVDGAEATVTGRLSADKNLRAETVESDAAAATDDGTTPGPPARTKTPPGADRTPGPPSTDESTSGGYGTEDHSPGDSAVDGGAAGGSGGGGGGNDDAQGGAGDQTDDGGPGRKP